MAHRGGPAASSPRRRAVAPLVTTNDGSESPPTASRNSGSGSGSNSSSPGREQVSDECWNVVSVDTASLSPFLPHEEPGRGSPNGLANQAKAQPPPSPTQMIEMAEKQTAADISNMPLQVTVSGERSLEADEQDPQPELSWWALTKMAAIWFGCSAVTNLLFFEAVPSQLRALVGEDAKTAALTVTVIVTATIILIISPVVGCLSDACDSRCVEPAAR